MLVVNRGRFERWGHLPPLDGGYGSKPRGAAKQIRPYGAEGYILVSTNWLLWLAFRRTNMDPYRLVSNSSRKLVVHFSKVFALNVSEALWGLSWNPWYITVQFIEKRATAAGNICKIVLTRPRPACVNHDSDSRCKHVPGMLLQECPQCNVRQG